MGLSETVARQVQETAQLEQNKQTCAEPEPLVLLNPMSLGVGSGQMYIRNNHMLSPFRIHFF